MTKYGLGQVVAFGAMILVVMVTVYVAGTSDIMSHTAVLVVEVVMGILLVWILAFFRDPQRQVPQGDNILVSPADGKVTDINVVEQNDVIGGKALKIGIFLSIFDVHINRAPCAARIDKVTYKPGQYTNAMNPSSAQVNESNDIAMTRLIEPKDALLVRQISGAIARRIVCGAEVGADFACGERFGMIKFGSRTELYVPARDDVKCLAKVGDKVKAGETVLAKYIE